MEFGEFEKAVEKSGKMEETGYAIICGVPTTLVAKEQIMINDEASETLCRHVNGHTCT